MTKTELLKKISEQKARSAWSRGVIAYAEELVEGLEVEEIPADNWAINQLLLNGAPTWKAYSWGGCSLIYNENMAQRLCSPSELKKNKNGHYKPNPSEQWPDVQARALYQAELLIKRIIFSSVAY